METNYTVETLRNIHSRLFKLEQEYYVGGNETTIDRSAHTALSTGTAMFAQEMYPRMLEISVDGWSVTLPEEIPPTNIGADWNENWTLRSKIAKINKIYSAMKYDRRRVGEACRDVPRGLHIFECPSVGMIITSNVIAEIEAIYRRPRDYPTVPRLNASDNIIFLRYPHGAETEQPTYADSLEIMQRCRLHHMIKLVKYYGSQLKHIFGITDNELDNSSVSIVRYDGVRNKGIRPHMDNFVPTDEDARSGYMREYLGPLITISLQNNVKYLDLMPMITSDTTLPSVRLLSGFGDIIVMDGQARLEYAHSVPESAGLKHSLCFKFKQFPRKFYYGEYNEILRTELLYAIPPWNNEAKREDVPDEVPQRA